MAAAQAMAMPTFVARCLEEIGLEGRCGLPVRDMFALVDNAGDVVYRKFAWNVLRAMGGQVAFHYMLRRESQTSNPIQKKKACSTAVDDEGDADAKDAATAGKREKRRRKWSTTLLSVDEGNADHAMKNQYADGLCSRQRTRKRRRVDANGNEAVVADDGEDKEDEDETNAIDERLEEDPVEEDNTQQRLTDRSSRSSQSRSSPTRSPQSQRPQARSSQSHSRSSPSRSPSQSVPKAEARSRQHVGDTESSDTKKLASASAVKPERSPWFTQSPRGYTLGEELDVAGLSYEDAVSETPDGVLGIVACAELRLKYLGVVDPSAIDTVSPQFDLLELIGRSREQGLNAALVAETGRFGDARKLHYLLDLLIACHLVVKNIVSADQKRFNMLHLTRFASQFHPSMISPSATLEKDAFPKEQLPHMIARILRSRGERTCVFADIGRELGYGKRHQEKLRKYFFHQMHIDAGFPLELFMARCNTGSDAKGRKLWVVRLRSTGRQLHATGSRDGDIGTGPVIERGIMEQMYANIQDRRDEGATIPELRDVLGVPTFKLPYKLAQGLISNYSLGVEQVVLGKSTMYRMFAPGMVKAEQEIPELEADLEQAIAEDDDTAARDEVDGKLVTPSKDAEIVCQPSTLKEATRGLVVGSTAERRRQYILERVTNDKIVSIHQLRTGLIEIERPKGKPVSDVGLVDTRSVRRIVDELVVTNGLVTIDITLPPKRVLQRGPKVVKCVALAEAQRDRDVLRTFIDGYLEQQQRKFLENLDHDNDAFIVVSNRLTKRMSKTGGGDASAFLKENENKEIVKYTAASYKLARVHLVMLHKQGRRLGMHFGIMYRCKAFHLLMWDRVPSLRASRGKRREDESQVSSAATTTGEALTSTVENRDLVFALKEILDLLTVREYIQLVGLSEVLTEAEENKVRMAIARGDSWDALSSEIVDKIRGCEADRFSRVLRVLIELGLVLVANDSSFDLLSAMRRSTDDFDQVISQVAFATLSGGVFSLQKKVRITLKRGNKLLKQLPHKNSYVYAAGFSGSHQSDNGNGGNGRVPLDFALANVDGAKRYWKALKFLCLEGARLGNGGQDAAASGGGTVNVDPELVQPAPLRDHNLYAMKVWVPRATTNYRAITERAKAAANAVEDFDPNGSLGKRKRFQSAGTSRVSGRAEKVQRRELAHAATSAYRDMDGDESGWRLMDGWGGAKSRVRAAKWSSEEDAVLMDHFVEKLSHQWFIDVPLSLQKRDERVAFRTTSLSRTKISWKGLASKLGRKREDCILRVRELMTVPAIQARVEKTKLAMTRAKNPEGTFHEELVVLKQPKLTALLCRALQIVFHERASYYSVLADMLISRHWKEAEVKLVWRYLWLGSVITRTKANDAGKSGQKQRGFCIHSHVSEMKSLGIPNYAMDFFCEAAEYASFLQQNVEEAELTDEDETSHESVFEQEIEANVPSGQIAIDLAALVMTTASFVPEFSPFSMDTHGSEPSGQPSKKSYSPSLQESKRSLAIKGFAGHLSKRFNGASPDDFLKEFWAVKAQYGTQPEADVRTLDREDLSGSTQAFSTSFETTKRSTKRRNDGEVVKLVKWLLTTLDAIGRNGATLADLQARFKTEHAGRACDLSTLKKALDVALSKRRCFEVNGSDSIRIVSASDASMWTLHPFRIGEDSTKDKVHFVFEQDRPIVSKPWLHLDGSVNMTIALMFKRRVVNIIMCSPGIEDHAIHKKMHRGLTLQDTRSLLDELLDEELLYARATRSHERRRNPQSVFDVGRRQPSEISLFSWTAGRLRDVDSGRDHLFYFPSVNCVELLGAAASDADIGRNE